MNTKKLLKIISEILQAEASFNFQSKLGQIQTHFQQNKPDELNQIKKEIFDELSDFPLNRYVGTDFKILKSLEIYGYFDVSLQNEIEAILGSQSHEVQQRLTNFVTKRADLLAKLRALKKSLEDLNIKVDTKDFENYQIAFSLPEKYHKLDNLQDLIKDVDRFLFDVSSSLKLDKDKYKIVSVSDGCIEIFIEVAVELAEKSVDFLNIVLQIQGAIGIFNKTKEGFEKYSKKNKASAEKIAKEELEVQKKKYIDEFVKSLVITGENKNDDENRIRGMFNKMVKYFEEGVDAEVRTPLIEKPREETEEDDKATIKQLRGELSLYERKMQIDETNKRLFLAQKDGLKLNLPEPESKDEN